MGAGSKMVKVPASKQIHRLDAKINKSAAKQSRKVSSVVKPKRVKAHVTRAIKNKEPKLVENTKNLLVMRGNKTNEDVNTLLRDLVRLHSDRYRACCCNCPITCITNVVIFACLPYRSACSKRRSPR